MKKMSFNLPTLEQGNIPKLQHFNIYSTKKYRVEIVAHVIDQNILWAHFLLGPSFDL